MHILFLTPYFNQPRGNSTTTKRLVHFLQSENIHTSVIPYLEADNWFLAEADIFHILHATRFLKWKKETRFILDRPYIVTMGGTDINFDLQEGMDDESFSFLNEAAYITVFTEDGRKKVCELFSGWSNKVIVIPQGIWVPWNISKLQGEMFPRILLPAGLRPVKDVLHVLNALDELILDYPNLEFTILGAKLDDTVYEKVLGETGQRKWLKYVGVVPYEVMKCWYDQAQIVINTSIAEGQSLALMEAMAVGRPVIARRNGANMQFIQHQQTGWLYETMDEFKDAVHSIMNNVSLCEKVTKEARKWIIEQNPPENEINSYVNLYNQILSEYC